MASLACEHGAVLGVDKPPRSKTRRHINNLIIDHEGRRRHDEDAAKRLRRASRISGTALTDDKIRGPAQRINERAILLKGEQALGRQIRGPIKLLEDNGVSVAGVLCCGEILREINQLRNPNGRREG